MNVQGEPARVGFGITALLLTSALVLSGCGDKEDEAATGVSSDPVSSTTPEATPEASVSASSEPNSATPGTSAAPSEEGDHPAGDPVALADCLPGNWYANSTEFAALMLGDTQNLVTDVTGSMMITFRADGSTDTHYDDWTYTFTVDTATVTIAKDGVDSGTYVVADDGGVNLTDTDIAATTEARMTIAGNEVIEVVDPQPSVFSLATFECSGDSLTASVGSQTATLGREH